MSTMKPVQYIEDIPAEFNIADWIIDRALENGWEDRTALIFGGDEITYADLAERTNRAGNLLLEAGIRPGDRVLLALGDSPEFVAAWYATLKIGAVTAEAYTFLQEKDFTYYLRYSQARAVIADAGTLERIRSAVRQSPWKHRIIAVGVDAAALEDGEIAWDVAYSAASSHLNTVPTGRDDIAIWKFTTGSTGSPKAVVHTHSAPRLSAESYGQGTLGLQPDDLVLPVPKLFFGYARDLTTLFPLAVGGAGIVYPERPTPSLLFGLIERHRPTVLVAVPSMMQQMLDSPDAAGRDLSSLRFCTSAGEALPPSLLERWTETFDIEVLDGLGSSEAYHVYISQRPGRVRPGKLGELVPGYSARLVNGQGDDVEPGEVGELWLQGPTTGLMYWGDRPKSLRTFVGDVVRTGDLLSRDQDGFYTYEGRADNLLKVGGIWVAPDEVERCLVSHEAVAETAVVGISRNGLTTTRAYVVPRPPATPGDDLADQLRAYVRETLSPHKYPREVAFVKALPKTGSGKLDRAAIRSLGAEAVTPGSKTVPPKPGDSIPA